MRSTKIWLAVVAVILCQVAAGAPNILIVTDDGQAAGSHVSMDQSVAFADYVGAGHPAAAQASLLGGRHEFATGVTHGLAGRNMPAADLLLMPGFFADAGYETAMIGCWLLGDGVPFRPEDRGFKWVCVHGGNGPGDIRDRWGNQTGGTWMRTKDGWSREEGGMADRYREELRGRLKKDEDAPPWLVVFAPAGDAKSAVEMALDELEASGVSENTIVVLASGTGGEARCEIRWPGKFNPAGRSPHCFAGDIWPTLASLCGMPMPEGWDGEGIDLSPMLLGRGKVRERGPLMFHPGGWPSTESPERHRGQGFRVVEADWELSGLELLERPVHPRTRVNVFEDQPEVAMRLLESYGAWWERMRPLISVPARQRAGDARQPVLRLTAHDWWPSLEAPGAASAERLATQTGVIRTLTALTKGDAPVSETSGVWKLHVVREGHYRIDLSLLPAEAPASERERIGRLKQGLVKVRAGRRELQMAVGEGAMRVSLSTDLPAGDLDLEAWFLGQLPEGRVLGAFFAEIERVGDRQRPGLGIDIWTEPKK